MKVEIPQTVTSIEKYAFGSSGGELYSFNKLEEITIPKSVVSMGDFIFYVGTALKIINCEAEENQQVGVINGITLYGNTYIS